MWTLPLISFAANAVSRYVRVARRRAMIRDLLTHDDRTLYDIGYSRQSLNWAMEQPEDDDLFEETRRMARREYQIGGAPQRLAAAPSLPC